MKLSTTLGFDGDPARYARKARDLESAGVDLVWSGEIYGFDLVSSLAYLAGQTTTLELMTGIIPIYSRTPALIAQTAATIDALSGGRFHLGLGSSGPAGHRGLARRAVRPAAAAHPRGHRHLPQGVDAASR